MTVLVLSATGNTGRATVRALLARRATVRAATRSPAAVKLPEGVDVVKFDLLDRSTWKPVLSGVDAMYLCLSTTLSGEFELPLALIEEAVAQGVKRIVTLSAFRAEILTYAPHKALEAAVEASGASWIHLRPNFFSENFFGFLGPDNTITLPAGSGRISFISVSDIGEAAAEGLLGDRVGEVWTLTGSEAINHYQVASILGDVLGREVQYKEIPGEAYAQMLTQYMEMPAQKAELISKVFAEDVAQDKYAPVFEDFPRVLGRAPTSFRRWAEANAAGFAS